jgi:hypothetical protein
MQVLGLEVPGIALLSAGPHLSLHCLSVHRKHLPRYNGVQENWLGDARLGLPTK